MDEKFLNKKQLEDEVLENIKEEYGFDEMKDAFDEAAIPHQLEFFYGDSNENFVQACNFLSLNTDNKEFIDFLVSDTEFQYKWKLLQLCFDTTGWNKSNNPKTYQIVVGTIALKNIPRIFYRPF